MSVFLIILGLILTWALCFVFTYRAFYKFILWSDGKVTENDRDTIVSFACLHIVGAIIAMFMLIYMFCDKTRKLEWFNNFLRKLEK